MLTAFLSSSVRPHPSLVINSNKMLVSSCAILSWFLFKNFLQRGGSKFGPLLCVVSVSQLAVLFCEIFSKSLNFEMFNI